jgi:H+/Cl- antiporter ClcA
MNTKVKKGIFWGVIVASTVMVINVLHFLLGGSSAFARGPGGHGEMGGRGGFAGRHMMNVPHHDGGFPWLFLIIGLAVLVLLVRWLRKKSKASSMQQFIDTSLAGSHIPVTNKNANVLDQWEKNILTKKENE